MIISIQRSVYKHQLGYGFIDISAKRRLVKCHPMLTVIWCYSMTSHDAFKERGRRRQHWRTETDVERLSYGTLEQHFTI